MSGAGWAAVVAGLAVAGIVAGDGWLVLKKKWTISALMQWLSGTQKGGWLTTAVWGCLSAHLFFPVHGGGHVSFLGLGIAGGAAALEVILARVTKWGWLPSARFEKLREKSVWAGMVPLAAGFAAGVAWW